LSPLRPLSLQVMDRITKTVQVQRRMLVVLRDSRQVTLAPLFQTFQNSTADVDGLLRDVEA
jgi:hypothetical protein